LHYRSFQVSFKNFTLNIRYIIYYIRNDIKKLEFYLVKLFEKFPSRDNQIRLTEMLTETKIVP